MSMGRSHASTNNIRIPRNSWIFFCNKAKNKSSRWSGRISHPSLETIRVALILKCRWLRTWISPKQNYQCTGTAPKMSLRVPTGFSTSSTNPTNQTCVGHQCSSLYSAASLPCTPEKTQWAKILSCSLMVNRFRREATAAWSQKTAYHNQ